MNTLSRFALFLQKFPGPLGCFGPRDANSTPLQWAWKLGRYLPTLPRHAVSGGARGIDSAFEAGFRKALKTSPGPIISIFKPDYKAHPTPGKAAFARTRLALRHLQTHNGGVVVFLPRHATRGGSLYTLKVATRLLLPTCVIWLGPDGEPSDIEFRNIRPTHHTKGDSTHGSRTERQPHGSSLRTGQPGEVLEGDTQRPAPGQHQCDLPPAPPCPAVRSDPRRGQDGSRPESLQHAPQPAAGPAHGPDPAHAPATRLSDNRRTALRRIVQHRRDEGRGFGPSLPQVDPPYKQHPRRVLDKYYNVVGVILPEQSNNYMVPLEEPVPNPDAHLVAPGASRFQRFRETISNYTALALALSVAITLAVIHSCPVQTNNNHSVSNAHSTDQQPRTSVLYATPNSNYYHHYYHARAWATARPIDDPHARNLKKCPHPICQENLE